MNEVHRFELIARYLVAAGDVMGGCSTEGIEPICLLLREALNEALAGAGKPEPDLSQPF